MKKISVFLSLFFILGFVGFANATSYNVALNTDVNLNGDFFTGGWGGGQTVTASTILDGVFLARGAQWDQGPVWWDSRDGLDRNITIDLDGIFSLESFVVQADDNDAYILSYWDLSSDTWQLAWAVPNYDAQGWGMQTRPDPANDSARYFLPGGSIITNALKFEGDLNDGDKLFSVSEIQAYGTPVPEPTTMLLLGIGLIGLAGLGSRRFIKK